MSVNQLHSLLEDFASQRKYREQKRILFLKRFQSIRNGFDLPQERLEQSLSVVREPHREVVPSHQRSPKVIQNSIPAEEGSAPLNQEEAELIRENKQLNETVGKLEAQVNEQMKLFQDTLSSAKTRYVAEIQKVVKSSEQGKKQAEAKMEKLKAQTEAALIKNTEIQEINEQIKKNLSEASGDSPDFSEIRKEYNEKLSSFRAIFESSNEKIEALENEFNEEEFVEGTIKNEELLLSLEENAKKAEEASKILEDYRTLNEGKREILNEIHNNNDMKEKEITKMCELEDKMKVIMEKMTKEKQIFVVENSRMAKELMEIKELLMASVGEGN